ncbi:hypothetical protein EBB59_12390, partial [Lysobacter pythonis]
NEAIGRTYFLSDHQNSTRALTNAAGQVVNRYDYDPYGNARQSKTGFSNPYQYTGRERDQTGLMYYRARYYRPDMGRFIAEDPIGLAGGLNTYGYVKGDPVSFIDPLGLQAYTPGLTPPPNIPGQPPGTFLGPPNGSDRTTCRYVSDGKNGGPRTAPKAYWKTKTPSTRWQRYNLRGNPITPGQAHPNNRPTVSPWSRAAWFIFLMTYSSPLNESEDQTLEIMREEGGS